MRRLPRTKNNTPCKAKQSTSLETKTENPRKAKHAPHSKAHAKKSTAHEPKHHKPKVKHHTLKQSTTLKRTAEPTKQSTHRRTRKLKHNARRAYLAAIASATQPTELTAGVFCTTEKKKTKPTPQCKAHTTSHKANPTPKHAPKRKASHSAAAGTTHIDDGTEGVGQHRGHRGREGSSRKREE